MKILYSWGKGKSGNTCHNVDKKLPTPPSVLISLNLYQLSLGPNHAAAIVNGDCLMWGEVLGRKHTTLFKIVWGRKVKMVSCGMNHTLLLTDNEQVWAMGENSEGQLGVYGDVSESAVPLRVTLEARVTTINAGPNVSGAIDRNGELYLWGNAKYGQLANGKSGDRGGREIIPIKVSQQIKSTTNNGTPTTQRQSLNLKKSYDSTSMTTNHNIVIGGKPQLNNQSNNLNGSGNNIINTVKYQKWVKVVFGGQHTLALTDCGIMYSWGVNEQGQLGLGHTNNKVVPVLVPFSNSIFGGENNTFFKITDICAGSFHSGAISVEGWAYTWGDNSKGQLGNGTLESTSSPCRVKVDVEDKAVRKMVMGDNHTMIQTPAGEVYTFGNSDYYQLGHGNTKNKTYPSLIVRPKVIASDIFAAGECSALFVEDSSNVMDNVILEQYIQQNNQTTNSSNNGSIPSLNNSNGTINLNNQNNNGEKRKHLSVWVGTWNCNGKRSTNLANWLLCNSFAPDVVVIGLQEIVDMKAGAIVKATAADKNNNKENAYHPWKHDIEKTLSLAAGGSKYVKVMNKILVGLMILVYVKEEHAPHVQDKSGGIVSCGAMNGKIGNKGGVGIRFTIYKTGFCFINSHFAAGPGHERMERRAQDFRKIQMMSFDNHLSPLDHECLIWCGDLNYRIDLSQMEAKQLICNKDWSILQASDQLNNERKAGRVFIGFSEQNITFPPSYKYDVGTSVYDTSEKIRTPSYTDRILYRGDTIKPIYYRRHELYESDHRPVSGLFLVEVKEFIETNVYEVSKNGIGFSMNSDYKISQLSSYSTSASSTKGGWMRHRNEISRSDSPDLFSGPSSYSSTTSSSGSPSVGGYKIKIGRSEIINSAGEIPTGIIKTTKQLPLPPVPPKSTKPLFMAKKDMSLSTPLIPSTPTTPPPTIANASNSTTSIPIPTALNIINNGEDRNNQHEQKMFVVGSLPTTPNMFGVSPSDSQDIPTGKITKPHRMSLSAEDLLQGVPTSSSLMLNYSKKVPSSHRLASKLNISQASTLTDSIGSSVSTLDMSMGDSIGDHVFEQLDLVRANYNIDRKKSRSDLNLHHRSLVDGAGTNENVIGEDGILTDSSDDEDDDVDNFTNEYEIDQELTKLNCNVNNANNDSIIPNTPINNNNNNDTTTTTTTTTNNTSLSSPISSSPHVGIFEKLNNLQITRGNNSIRSKTKGLVINPNVCILEDLPLNFSGSFFDEDNQNGETPTTTSTTSSTTSTPPLTTTTITVTTPTAITPPIPITNINLLNNINNNHFGGDGGSVNEGGHIPNTRKLEQSDDSTTSGSSDGIFLSSPSSPNSLINGTTTSPRSPSTSTSPSTYKWVPSKIVLGNQRKK